MNARTCRRSNIGRRNRLPLRNAPDASIASIHFQGVARTGLSLILEYPFVAEDGTVNVPEADNIHETIYCRSAGANAREQEKEGRCLPD